MKRNLRILPSAPHGTDFIFVVSTDDDSTAITFSVRIPIIAGVENPHTAQFDPLIWGPIMHKHGADGDDTCPFIQGKCEAGELMGIIEGRNFFNQVLRNGDAMLWEWMEEELDKAMKGQ